MNAQAGSGTLTDRLATPGNESLLRFITCGSVDDGKSTLIGRLLYDAGALPDDERAALFAASGRTGGAYTEPDYAALVDGLAAEREQGITIDVAYRSFATARRRFIIADTPGHEQYTRNMATGASNADLAVILVDARLGILPQTRRHAFIVSLLGVRHVVLAVNKIDLVDFAQTRFDDIAAAFRDFAAGLNFKTLVAIPLSARHGDNVSARSPRTLWYRGPSLLEHLESVPVADDALARPFRMPVQWINRSHADFRSVAGTVASGDIRPGDSVVVAGSGRLSTVRAIVTADGELPRASAGEAVTLVLADDIDVSRGDVLAAPTARPEVSDHFAAHVIWMSEVPLFPGRPYLLKIGARTVTASVTEIRHRIDVGTFQKLAARTLGLNEIGVVNIATQQPVAFDPFAAVPQTGAFILIDRIDDRTLGAGMIDFGLRRATNVQPQALAVSKTSRAALKQQKPVILWFTGLSGAGKSTVANLVEKTLHAMGRHTTMLDGDNVRHGLNKDLGFTDADRIENIRRVAETAKLCLDAGLIVLTAFISPFRAERLMARERVESGEFVEIHIDIPLALAERRDPKGLYARARQGLIANFTGIDSPYEPPEAPELRLDAAALSPEQMAAAIVAYLTAKGYLS